MASYSLPHHSKKDGRYAPGRLPPAGQATRAALRLTHFYWNGARGHKR